MIQDRIKHRLVSQIPFNGQPTFSDQNFIPNANLRPGKTTSYELGTDIRFIKI
jgi:outer membrane receptor protein involved in Fe transport